ncbi:MAG: DUF1549 domain-containing protein [Planctomycetes bacterium]|nr:DUF1549 domain-containing protein [Planctomycetota bacterium]
MSTSTKPPRRTFVPFLAALAIGWATPAVRAGDGGRLTFERDVRPILKAHCFHCHGEEGDPEGGLDLRLRRLIAAGGDSGPALVPGEPSKSYLVERIAGGEMPPGDDAGKKLSASHVDTIRRWIAAGAPTAGPEPESLDGPLFTAEERNFWSFQPVTRPAIPAVGNRLRVRTPIDAFVLARLGSAQLAFAPDADHRTLIRRATIDLLGLPPTPAEIEQFLKDESPDAYERLIDRLLASPHYGERWGRHWLDAAGYADSEGHSTEDPVREHAWRYRDYVIRSFNADKPLDEFIIEQLAGDELVSPPYNELPAADIEKLIATGFLRTAPDGTAESNTPEARNAVIAETLKVVTSSLLGLTVGCAQCHDHRYDPIPQRDYYSLRAIFEPAFDWKDWRTPKQRLVSLYSQVDREEASQVEAEARMVDEERTRKQVAYIQQTLEKDLAKLTEDVRDEVRAALDVPEKKRSKEQRSLLKKYPSTNVTAGSLYLYDKQAADELKALAERAADIRRQKPVEEFVRALTEVAGKVPEMHVFHRGDHEQPKELVEPAGLSILALTANGDERGSDATSAVSYRSVPAIPQNDPSLTTTGRRLAFARSLVGGSHPLTARVLANRVWMHHFGRGLVETPDDFGVLGARPTHPEVLDWLAAELIGQRSEVRNQKSDISSAQSEAASLTASGPQPSTLNPQPVWSLKRLHRQILLSTTYRQQLATEPEARRADPEGRLYAGRPLRRMEAEVVRDAVLSLSGNLNPKAGGPPVPVMADRVGQFVVGIENLNAGRPGEVIPMHGEEFRRSVYVQARRSRPLAVLDAFDLPQMEPNCTRRASSTVAPQSLLLMNNEFVVAQSQAMAARVQREAGDDPQAQVSLAWELAFAGEPTAEELAEAVAFLSEQSTILSASAGGQQQADAPPPALGALASFCQTLIGSNRFLYID